MERFVNARQAINYFDGLYGKKTYSQYKRYANIIKQFKKRFNEKACYLATSSGRVELIGNHTDHNGGRVLGCCVDLDVVAAFLPNNDGKVRVYGEKYSPIVFDIADSGKVQSGSIGLVKGVLAYLAANGYKVGGFTAYCSSVLPSGAGISSSAAFETLIGVIQSGLYNDGSISAETLARAGQYAENVYFNKPCGLLDQSVVAFGGLVALDFANGVHCEKLNARFDGMKLALINTGKSHSNLTHLYAAIPQEMKAVAAYFGKERLIDVNYLDFQREYVRVQNKVGARPALRAKHFFEENVRVDEAKNALLCNDLNAFISLINQSGQSSMNQLQNCAVDENDVLISDAVRFVRSLGNVGARVHGGGFAGTVLCVIPKDLQESVCADLRVKYGGNNVLPLTVRTIGAAVL